MEQHPDRIAIPSLFEMIGFTTVGGALVLLGVFFSSIQEYDVRYYNFFSTSSKDFIDKQLHFLDTPQWTTVITFFLWMICGILTYIAIWFSISVVRSYKDDQVPLHGFLAPRGYHRSNEVSTRLARGFIRFTSLLLFFTGVITILRSLLPYLTKVCISAIHPFTYSTLPTFIVAAVLLGASMYISVVFLRFTFLRRRLFGGNIYE